MMLVQLSIKLDIQDYTIRKILLDIILKSYLENSIQLEFTKTDAYHIWINILSAF